MKFRASVLIPILLLHACVVFVRWHATQNATPATLTTPLRLVSVALQPAQEKVARKKPSPTRTTATANLPTPPTPAAPPPDSAPTATTGVTVDPPAPGIAGLELQVAPVARTAAGPNHAAQMAMNDPRSNTPRPTGQERFDIAAGSYACVYTERLPDGTVYRGPGVWDTAPNPDAMYKPSGVVGTKGMGWGRNKVCRRQ